MSPPPKRQKRQAHSKSFAISMPTRTSRQRHGVRLSHSAAFSSAACCDFSRPRIRHRAQSARKDRRSPKASPFRCLCEPRASVVECGCLFCRFFIRKLLCETKQIKFLADLPSSHLEVSLVLCLVAIAVIAVT